MAYLAVVLDVYSRKIVGWAQDRTHSAQLMVDALRQVIARGPCEAMICHSDQGSQYTSKTFRLVCEANHIRQSVGSVGDCYDNAMAESFFSTLKSECTFDRPFETLAVAEREIGCISTSTTTTSGCIRASVIERRTTASSPSRARRRSYECIKQKCVYVFDNTPKCSELSAM